MVLWHATQIPLQDWKMYFPSFWKCCWQRALSCQTSSKLPELKRVAWRSQQSSFNEHLMQRYKSQPVPKLRSTLKGHLRALHVVDWGFHWDSIRAHLISVKPCFLPPLSSLCVPFLPFPSFLFHQKLYSLGSLSNKPSLLCTLPYLLHTLVRTSISKRSHMWPWYIPLSDSTVPVCLKKRGKTGRDIWEWMRERERKYRHLRFKKLTRQ